MKRIDSHLAKLEIKYLVLCCKIHLGHWLLCSISHLSTMGWMESSSLCR